MASSQEPLSQLPQASLLGWQTTDISEACRGLGKEPVPASYLTALENWPFSYLLSL